MPDWQIALAAFHLFMLLIGGIGAAVTAVKSEPPAIVRESDGQPLDADTLQVIPCRESK